MQDAQRQLLDLVLRRLHVALKTFRLYSPSHAVAKDALPNLVTTLQQYLDRFGPLTIQVGKDRLEVAGAVVHDSGTDSLAFFLYVRNLAGVTFHPGLTQSELGTLLSLLSQDRQTIDAGGGVEHLARSRDFGHVVLRSVALGADDTVSEAETFHALTQAGRLSPQQREAVLGVLREGPTPTAALLTRLYELAAGAAGEDSAARVQPLIQVLQTLDRTILDEPLEDQAPLFRTLAEAHLHLAEPLRSSVAGEVLARAADGGAARTIVGELSSQEIAQLILGCVDQGAIGGQVARFLEQLAAVAENAPEVAAILQSSLSPRGIVIDPLPVPPAAQALRADDAGPGGWVDVPPALLTIQSADEPAQRTLVAEATEGVVAAEIIPALAGLLTLEDDPVEIVETAKALAGHLPGLAARGEFDRLASALRTLDGAKGRAGPRAAAIESELERVLDEGLLDVLVGEALKEPTTVSGVREALGILAPGAVPRVIRALEREPLATRRRRLCGLLGEICAGRTDLLGMYVPSASWYLTRNLVFVLGDQRDPAGVRVIARVIEHPEYRVRREAIDALRKIDAPDARASLARFFLDPDPRVQHHMIESVGGSYDGPVADWLLKLVRSADYTPRAVALTIAALKALARMRAPEALPVVRRIARFRWVIGRNRRTVRTAAREIVAEWERAERQAIDRAQGRPA